MNLTEIAQSFSTGKFSEIQNYFSDNIVWNIVGEQQLTGLKEVTQHCLSIEKYFKTTLHEFNIQTTHSFENSIVIQGEAHFFEANKTTHISACDVYTFNSDGKLIHIQSYCIINKPKLAE